MIKACIFDLDGVIVDTAKYHYIAWKEIATGLGFEFTEQHNERLKGVSRMQSLDILLEVGNIRLQESMKLQLAEQKNNRYLELVLRMSPDEILPGALELLKEARAAGIKTALGSASKNAMTILELLGITPYFDAIVDGYKAPKAKPDPQVFLSAASELEIMPSNCVVFEDAEAGVEAALSAGMACIGVGNPSILAKANAVIPDLKDFSLPMLWRLIPDHAHSR